MVAIKLICVDVIRNSPGLVSYEWANPADVDANGDWALYAQAVRDGVEKPLRFTGRVRPILFTTRTSKREFSQAELDAAWLLGSPPPNPDGPTIATADWWMTFYDRRDREMTDENK